ncbi:tagatose-6-phosphate kinase [Alphaproteobacteria bacterium]|nr:tagatose-6-phosphate kinase [Alphaproteobacteria bacterium]
MLHQRLLRYLHKRRCTLLGIGPMSVNCVDAVLELANVHEIPLMLIASRRQIDSERFGGGYVNRWTTDELARYVIDRDKKGKVLLARDHGGPWQNSKEVEARLTLRRAMESAKASYLSDIEAGFEILHIDPSVDIHGSPGRDEILDRLFELYEFCWVEAQRLRREVIFEIGTEEQSGGTNTVEEQIATIEAVQAFCRKNHLPLPSFIVLQTGTKVMETRNIGSFDTPFRVAGELPAEIQVPKMIEVCNRYDILMKEHNTDYMSDETLMWHPRLGIHAANVAPEFGVTETRALVDMLEANGCEKLAGDFLELSYASRKWEKWVIDSKTLPERECAIISGHYVFSDPGCLEIKSKAIRALSKKGIDLENYLKENVKKAIMRYLLNFRMVLPS